MEGKMAQKYYDVYVFDWGCSEGKVRRVLMLNRAYHKIPGLLAGSRAAEGRTSLSYRVAPDEVHNKVTFFFDEGGLCEAVYSHQAGEKDGFKSFDAFLAQVKELARRYGTPELNENDAKERTGHVRWTTDRTVIDYRIGDSEAPGESRLVYSRR